MTEFLPYASEFKFHDNNGLAKCKPRRGTGGTLVRGSFGTEMRDRGDAQSFQTKSKRRNDTVVMTMM